MGCHGKLGYSAPLRRYNILDYVFCCDLAISLRKRLANTPFSILRLLFLHAKSPFGYLMLQLAK